MKSISGIYVIVHRKSGNLYIGQAQDIYHRWKQHRWALKRGDHANLYLQRAWNKYGAKAFDFVILERCSIDMLNEREQHFLNVYVPKGKCYNISIDVETRMRGASFTDEHKRKMSEAAKGRKHSAETRLKISAANRMKSPKSAETRHKLSLSLKGHECSIATRQKIGMANGGRYIVISPQGDEFEIINLSQFCRENNLTVANMNRVAQGKRAHHKGWKCRKLTP